MSPFPQDAPGNQPTGAWDAEKQRQWRATMRGAALLKSEQTPRSGEYTAYDPESPSPVVAQWLAAQEAKRQEPAPGAVDAAWTEGEPTEVLVIFTEMLAAATGDGAKKRQAGTKPSWKVDQGHETALFSHLHAWKNGQMADPDSGAHPLVHAAWRLLAIAYQENGGTVYTHKHRKDPGTLAEQIEGRPDKPTDAEREAFVAKARSLGFQPRGSSK